MQSIQRHLGRDFNTYECEEMLPILAQFDVDEPNKELELQDLLTIKEALDELLEMEFFTE